MLTYMATLIELTLAGELIKLDPALGLREMEQRRIYMLPRAATWLAKDLVEAESTHNIEESPAQQLDALLYEFCVGQAIPVVHRFKALDHLADGIWELKTADLRLFGWFAYKDCFIICDCNLAREVKRMNMYRAYCEQAVRFRNVLNLDEPKFISGDNPHDVVSDCYFP
jgi:hypothetical protein